MGGIKDVLARRIREYREKYGFSQSDLALRLGLNRVIISQMENGERKISAEELAKLAEVFNISTDTLLDLDKEVEVIMQKSDERQVKSSIRISVPQQKVEKFKEVLLYILNRVGAKPNIGEVVLYKLLYFIDFNYYEKYEEQLMGLKYQKNQYGPTPIEFRKVLNEMERKKEVLKVKDNYYQYPQTKYLPLRKPDLSVISGREKEVIDTVLEALSDMNATKISELSHGDVPWLVAEKNEIIDYEAVFYRTPEYSVRNDEEDFL